MKVILLLALFVFGRVIGDTSPFGTTFYIPVTNLLNRDLKGGLTILQDLQTDCIKTDYQSSSLEGIRSRMLFGNTGSFYNYLASATAMSSELGRDFTMGYTLDKIEQCPTLKLMRVLRVQDVPRICLPAIVRLMTYRGIQYGIKVLISLGTIYYERKCRIGYSFYCKVSA